MKILVFGAGAIGSAFGGFLSPYHEVTLLGRRLHLEAIRRSGLKISGIWGRHCFKRFHLVTDIKELQKEKRFFDLILVTVKSYDTAQAGRDIRKILQPPTLVISLQNGLGNIEVLRRYVPPSRLLAGRVIFGVELEEPGKIKITVIAAPTALGETSRRGISARVRRLSQEFSRAGLPCEACGNVGALLWLKTIYNCALNPLASLLGCHYGFLTEHTITRRLMDAVIYESYKVAGKAGVRLPVRTAEGYRRLFYSKLVPRTYDHHPSMLQDLHRGKRTEIDALNGAIVCLGRKYGIATPVNTALVSLMRRQERKVLRQS